MSEYDSQPHSQKLQLLAWQVHSCSSPEMPRDARRRLEDATDKLEELSKAVFAWERRTGENI